LPARFIIANVSDSQTVQFWIKNMNYPNYRSISDMLESIIDSSMNDEQIAIALWNLVSCSGFHHDYEYRHQLNDHVDPISLLTFPYFMCGEKAGILFNLSTYAGLNSRIVRLHGHIANEIFFNNEWHFFDADEGYIFRNNDNKILSAEELKFNRSWIDAQYANFSCNEELHVYWQYKRYFKEVTYQDDVTDFVASNHKKTMDIILYPKDKVVFAFYSTTLFVRFINEKFRYKSLGTLIRKLNKDNANVVLLNDSTIKFMENFPYFITRLHIFSSTNINAEVFFIFRNRITNRTEQQSLGILNDTQGLIKKFNAPESPEIFYEYTLLFKGIKPKEIRNIIITQEFFFNTETFLLDKPGLKTLETETPHLLKYCIETIK